MANTKIQIKRSSATATPTNGSLQAGELAYSYNSEKLFLGTANSANVQEIGGTYWVGTTIAAFNAANSGGQAFANSTANSANAYAVTVGAASNTWANSVGTAGNNYTNAVGTAGNNYAIQVGAASNTWANAVGTAGNNYTNAVGTAGNNYAIQVGAASNTWANSVGTAGNNYVNSTFVKLTATSQTITGDLAITGNLTLLGNATSIVSNNLIVGDSLIYLASNNYTGTDILDIGFVANYGNATAANVHTGLIRDATTKQYYLFQGYDAELQSNNQSFTMGANNSTFAALNADIVTSNLNLGGANAITWINSLYPYANGVANSANAYTVTVGTAGNNYAVQVGAASNTWANSIGTAGNNYTNAVGTAGNNYAVQVGAASNTWANTIAQNWANTRLANVIATSGRTVVTWSTTNGYTNATLDLATTAVSAATYGGTDQIPSFTVDAYGRLTFAGNNGINVGAATAGTLPVARGGTGNTTFTANSVLIGNGTNPVWGLFSSTEGHLLQVSAAGAPQFAMLDGGTF